MICPVCKTPLEDGLPYCYSNGCTYQDPKFNYREDRNKYNHSFTPHVLATRIKMIHALASNEMPMAMKHFILLLPPDTFYFTLFNTPKLKFDAFPIDRYESFPERIKYSLFETLLKVFITFELDVSRTYNWRILWCTERIKYKTYDQSALHKFAIIFESDRYTAASEQFYNYCLSDGFANDAIYRSYSQHLFNNKQYNQSITLCENALRKYNYPDSHQFYYKRIIECDLLKEKTDDLEFTALHYLALLKSESLWIDEKHDELLSQALEYYTPDAFKIGRGNSQSFVGALYRGLISAGKNIGKLFGGRDSSIPHSKAVMDSVARLLPPIAVADYLKTQNRIDDEIQSQLTFLDLEQGIAVGSVFPAEHIYWMSLINTDVLHAMTFSAAGHPSELSELRAIADHVATYTSSGVDGFVNRLAGYVGEQHAAHTLLEQGHSIEFPATDNNPGYDMLVDGSPMQVKLTQSPELIYEHFQHYPDIPVITNAEMSQYFSDNHMVIIDHSMNYEQIHQQTTHTLEGLSHHGSMQIELLAIPLISIAFSTVRNWRKWQGSEKLGDFSKIVATDVTYRSVSGFVGAKVGGLGGAIFGPVGMTLGAMIGGFLGTIAGGTGSTAKLDPALCDCRDQIIKELYGFATWFQEELLQYRITYLTNRLRSIEAWILEQTTITNLHKFAYLLQVAAYESLHRALSLNKFLLGSFSGGSDQAVAHAGWIALDQACYFYHVDMQKKISGIDQLLNKYKQIYANQ